MRHFKNLIIALFIMLVSEISYSQIIPPVNAASTYTLTPGQTTSFYDPSGPGGNACGTGTVAAGNYSNCGCFTTITINAAVGEFLSVNFNEFSMWNTTSGWDWMTIHDGPTIASPTIFNNSAGGANNPLGDCGIGSSILNFCSTGRSMTFRFYATSVVNRAGWDATVTSINSPCITVLPIELVEFDGIDDDGVNKLWWVTASEINNDYFEVKRSEDGIHWEHLTRVEGAGNSNTPILYEIVDEDPFISYTYYSLSHTDFDGKVKEFDIISVENKKSVFYIYHKGNDYENIYFSSPYYYEVYNMMGQLIKSETGDSVYVGDLPSGMHLLKIGSHLRKFYVK